MQIPVVGKHGTSIEDSDIRQIVKTLGDYIADEYNECFEDRFAADIKNIVTNDDPTYPGEPLSIDGGYVGPFTVQSSIHLVATSLDPTTGHQFEIQEDLS